MLFRVLFYYFFFIFLTIQKTSAKLFAAIWGWKVDSSCIISVSNGFVSRVSTFILKK